jgi:hypothetical protein
MLHVSPPEGLSLPPVIASACVFGGTPRRPRPPAGCRRRDPGPPETPSGHAANWVPTRADGGFEVLFRFYGPKPALFDKTWVPPDLVGAK